MVTRSVQAPLNFVDAPREMRRVARVREADGSSHHPLRAATLTITDARTLATAPSLSREGFAVIRHETALRDFRDDEELKRVYLPEMAELVRSVTQADAVFMTPGVGKRITDARRRALKEVTNAIEGAGFVHLDYSEDSVWEFLTRAIGDATVDLKRYARVVTYNLWRALSPPPQDMPLALCDMRTTSLDDLVTARAEFGERNFQFDISLVRHAPRQSWFYFPDLSASELLMFKVWTLKPAQEQAVFHGAFYDPSCPAGAAPRVSIEARAFALFE